MRVGVLAVLMIGALTAIPVAAADLRATETIKTYRIEGRSGPELYASIGARGPKLGAGRVIAHTGFKLTWRRDYQRQGDDCVLASAAPRLVITYTLPQAPKGLPSPTAANWARFRAGVEAHEKVHGDFIKAMTREIMDASIGLREADDPDCQRIRATLTARLQDISARERAQHRDFDRVEMGEGGGVQQLILMLVNGG